MITLIKKSFTKNGFWGFLKSAIKFIVDPNRPLRPQYYPPDWIRLKMTQITPWFFALKNKNHHIILSEKKLLETRTSDTLFIFGSGYSINQITNIEIKHFESNQTLSFNWFPHQKLVKIDYHLIREITHNDFSSKVWKPALKEYTDLISNNQFYSDTTFLMQKGLKAINSNRILQYKLISKSNRIFQWNSLRIDGRISNSISKGLSHKFSTLFECINFGYLMGWKHIVLVGIDLYDKRYFWLPYDKMRNWKQSGSKVTELHNTARPAMFGTMKSWASQLNKNGTELYVYNPKSLLSSILPIYPKPPNTETSPKSLNP